MTQMWRKLMAAFCAVSLLMTMSGGSAYAADFIDEESIEVFEATADEVEDSEDISEEDAGSVESETAAETIDSQSEMAEEQAETVVLSEECVPAEEDTYTETVGSGTYTVGDGVTAIYDSDDGSILLMTSTGGTLWRDWLEKAGIERDSVKSIKVLRKLLSYSYPRVKLPADSSGHKVADSYLFGGLRNLETLDLGGFDTSNVTNMSDMFCNCESLTNLDLSGFNTSKVTNMNGMFSACTKLKTLDLSSFNTSKVTDMSYMFFDCTGLTSLNLKGLDTSKVTKMEQMFWCCESLKTLDLSGLNTSKVTDMSDIFANCTGLTKLNINGLNTSNVTDMSAMFYRCESLTTIDVSSFDTSKVINMSNLFTSCKSLKKIDVSHFKTSNVIEMAIMFYECESLTTLDLSAFDTSHVWTMYAMFEGCKNLQSINLRSFNTTSLQFMHNMFRNCAKLKYLDIGSFDASKVTHAEFMFEGCKALEILVTPKNRKNISECYFSHTMYDRNGKVYYQLPVNESAKVLGRTKDLAASIFMDVRDPSHPYYTAIYWAVEQGITKGYPDGTFGIDRSCTRGEMVMFLWRYAGKPEPKAVSKSPFKDVPASHTFYKAVLWAYQNGITKGYSDGTFGVNRNVSRGESMMFLWRLKGKPEPTPVSVSPFKDVPTNHAFYKAILWGSQQGITKGYTTGPKKGSFGINDNCTRGQIVTFLYRARNL